MPFFMIERNFANQLEENAEGAAAINRINMEEGVRWIISFLSTDRRKTFCLYEAPSAEAIREAARHAGIPADSVMEVGEEILDDGMINRLNIERFGRAQTTQNNKLEHI